MKIPTLGLWVFLAAVPLRAQNLFVVVENGVRSPVKAIVNHHPQIETNGKLHSASGQTYSISKAVIYGRGLIDVSAFKVEGTNAYSEVGQPQLHIYGRLKSDIALKNCYFVVELITDTEKGVIYDALPDLTPNQQVFYDQLFDLPIHNLFTNGTYRYHLFSNGLEIMTTIMPPMYVSQQRQRTEAYFHRKQSQ